MRKSEPSTGSRLLRAGIATAATAALVVGAAAPAFAASVPLTLSSTTGPSAGGNTITATAATAFLSGVTTPAVTFQVGTACSATYVGAAAVTATAGVVVVSAANVKKLANNKISITVPAGVALTGTQTSAKFNICVYSGTTVAATGVTGSPLVGNATYTVSAKATITGVTPAAGPALGGTTITVTGTNFPATGMTASIGGTALRNIVVGAGGTSFTAVTAPRAAGDDLTLSVTTSGGTVNRTTAFSYSNGIVVAPNTAPTNTTVDVDVMGVGFTGMTFTPGAASTTDDAHVYLVEGDYDPTADTTTTTNKANGPLAECTGVLVVSDTELICTLDLGNSLSAAGAAATADVPNGTYTMTVVSNGLIDATTSSVTANYDPDYTESIISSGSTFTVAPY